MNKNTEIVRMDVKKTTVKVTISNPVDKYSSPTETVKDLILKTVIIGGSANCINQLIEGRLSHESFERIKEAKEEFNRIASNLQFELSGELDGIKIENHRFH
jgi:hypothetical protein